MAPPARVQLDAADVWAQAGPASGAGRLPRGTGDGKKNAPTDTLILFEDESHIRAYQAIGATWFLRGHQKQVPTYGHHAGVALFGAVDIRGGTVAVQQATDLTAQTFQGFVEGSFAKYPDKRLVLICDNAKIHHAKCLEPFWEHHRDRLRVWCLPAYSPNLNPTERVWKWLKSTVICNAFHADVQAIQTSVERFLAYLNTVPDDVRSRLCA